MHGITMTCIDWKILPWITFALCKAWREHLHCTMHSSDFTRFTISNECLCLASCPLTDCSRQALTLNYAFPTFKPENNIESLSQLQFFFSTVVQLQAARCSTYFMCSSFGNADTFWTKNFPTHWQGFLFCPPYRADIDKDMQQRLSYCLYSKMRYMILMSVQTSVWSWWTAPHSGPYGNKA